MDTVLSRLRLVRSDKTQGRIEAQSGVSAMSWGEVVTVIVDPATDADSHTVEVISAKKMTITGRNWAPMLLAEISHRLD